MGSVWAARLWKLEVRVLPPQLDELKSNPPSRAPHRAGRSVRGSPPLWVVFDFEASILRNHIARVVPHDEVRHTIQESSRWAPVLPAPLAPRVPAGTLVTGECHRRAQHTSSGRR